MTNMMKDSSLTLLHICTLQCLYFYIQLFFVVVVLNLFYRRMFSFLKTKNVLVLTFIEPFQYFIKGA